jgi:hypothetical protein
MANIPYQRVVGCLIYVINCAQRNIVRAADIVSQYLEYLGVKQWNIIKQIMRYVNGTATYGVHYGPNTRDTQVVRP